MVLRAAGGAGSEPGRNRVGGRCSGSDDGSVPRHKLFIEVWTPAGGP